MITATDLAARWRKAAIEGRWATTMSIFAGPAALIIDELGYLPLPADDANALFQVISQAAHNRAVTRRRGGTRHVDSVNDATQPGVSQRNRRLAHTRGS